MKTALRDMPQAVPFFLISRAIPPVLLIPYSFAKLKKLAIVAEQNGSRPVALVRLMTFISGLLFGIGLAASAELKVTDLTIGSGEEADVGKTVTVHYTGWLMDGTKFDSSVDRGVPFDFTLGERRVIPGWEQGVVGMKVGGKRELIIPPELAYGSRGAGGVIPPDATLKFEVELLAVKGKQYTDLDNSTLKRLIAEGVPVVDIRRPDEWKSTGVIEGSHLITFFDKVGQPNPDFLKHLNEIAGPSEQLVFICRTGNRSSVLSKYLSERGGYTQIANVQKGIVNWIGEGNPVSTATMPESCWLC